MTASIKLNVLLAITLLNTLGMCLLLLFVAINVPTARDIGTLVQNNKDRLNHTISMILDTSEQAERILNELRSFIEGRVMRAICSSKIIRSAVGFLCDFVYPSDGSLSRALPEDDTLVDEVLQLILTEVAAAQNITKSALRAQVIANLGKIIESLSDYQKNKI